MRLKKTSRVADRSGQSTVELILLLSAISAFSLLIVQGFRKYNLAGLITRPLTTSFKYTYQYGHPDARGFDDPDGPKMHPRVVGGDPTNLRIFINPRSQ